MTVLRYFSTAHPSLDPFPGHVKLIQWNVERGLQLEKIIELLKKLKPDICCLQELDIGCRRSGNTDTVKAIAEALNMNAVFVTEFVELDEKQDESKNSGLHGNAILSRWPLTNVRVIEHRYQPYHWERDGHLKNQRRIGKRRSIVAAVDTPIGSILCYSLHFEVFCGVVGRLAQLSEILYDASSQANNYQQIAILGDLNTMNHGIARLAPGYCNDCLRWRLPLKESDWIAENVFGFDIEAGPTNAVVQSFFFEHVLPHMQPIPFLADALGHLGVNDVKLELTIEQQPPLSPLTPLMEQNLTKSPGRYLAELDHIFVNLRNSGFYDPFDVPTLHSHFGMYAGKLDWMLVRHLEITRQLVANNDYSASDHKLLYAEVRTDSNNNAAKKWIESKRNSRIQRAFESNVVRTRKLLWLTGASALAFGMTWWFLRRK